METETALHSILSVELLVVYGRSGMGKTSLLSAGVFQQLRDRDLWPIMLRLNKPDRTPIELIDEQIRAAADAAGGLDLVRHPSGQVAPQSLWDLLSALEVWKGKTLLQPVLVFDQFEELFTLGWEEEERRAFISGLGEIVRRRRSPARDEAIPDSPLPPPDVKIVLSLREDALGELEALSTDIPQVLRNRIRVLGLDEDQAERAIREPATSDDPRLHSARFRYTEEAAAMLLEFLRTGEERGETVLKERVDPSQLQVVCQHIERVILPRKSAEEGEVVEITSDDLGGFEGLNNIVHDFYRREVDSFPPEDRAKVKELCETGLISRSGRRLSLEESEIEAEFGVSRELLDALIDRRLLRAEPRVGSVYYELAHDTLVAPTMAYRQERQEREAVEREQTARASRLDRWASRSGLANALLVGVLGGFSMALSLVALRSPPTRRRGRWKRRLALGVGFAWMLLWALTLWAPDTLKSKLVVFLLFIIQPALGVVAGLAWPVGGATERRHRRTWFVGIATIAVVAVGAGGLLVGERLTDPSPSASFLDTMGGDSPDVGDCVNWVGESFEPVGCEESHQYELYAVPALGGPADDYPGDDWLLHEVQQACLEAFEPYVGRPYGSSIYDFTYRWPSDVEWTQGKRSGMCLVHLYLPTKESRARDSGE